MNFRGWRSLLLVVLPLSIVCLVLLFAAVDVEAQCSMCRASLTNAANARLVRGMNLGVLVLLVPPVTIFCSIFIILRRYRGNG
jgi:di/tricarboxylate transporter